MDIVYLNGDYIAAREARISVFDRGFLFSDSVYEVIPFYQGIGFQLEQHLARLAQSLSAINIQIDLNLAAMLNELVARNGFGNQSVYMQITRGVGNKRSHALITDISPTIFAFSTPIVNNYSTDVDKVFPVKVIVSEDLRWGRCDIKTTGLLPNILAMQHAKLENAQEALLERNGYIQEGASSNFFIVKDDLLIAPKSSHAVLKGTTSQLVKKIAETSDVSFCHSDITYQQLINADEVWIASSTRGLLPVGQVDSYTIGNGAKGALWQKLYLLLAEYQNGLLSDT